MVEYQNIFPYLRAVGPAKSNFHKREKDFLWAYRFKQYLPTMGLYYATRVVGTKQMASDAAELKEGVEAVW